MLPLPGSVVLVGSNRYGQCDLPYGCISQRFEQVSCGWYHTVVLSSDGRAYACGGNEHGQCEIPIGKPYKQVSAGGRHTVLLHHPSGVVSACGDNSHGQCDIPELDGGIWYTQVSAGIRHTVLLRSDGMAVAFGHLRGMTIPVLPEGMTYTQVCASSTGEGVTALVRSDGTAMSLAGAHVGQKAL